MRDAFFRGRWPTPDTAEAPDAQRSGSVLPEIGVQLAPCLAVGLLACLVFGVP